MLLGVKLKTERRGEPNKEKCRGKRQKCIALAITKKDNDELPSAIVIGARHIKKCRGKDKSALR